MTLPFEAIFTSKTADGWRQPLPAYDMAFTASTSGGMAQPSSCQKHSCRHCQQPPWLAQVYGVSLSRDRSDNYCASCAAAVACCPHHWHLMVSPLRIHAKRSELQRAHCATCSKHTPSYQTSLARPFRICYLLVVVWLQQQQHYCSCIVPSSRLSIITDKGCQTPAPGWARPHSVRRQPASPWTCPA